jgi:hypothetical protein
MNFPKVNKINILKLTNNIIHIAKPPNHEIDIYSEYITKDYNWKIETYQHEHNSKLTYIKSIKYEHFEFTSIQDYSKWAASNDEYYWIGDLDHTSSQYKCGGGGFICKDRELAICLNKLIN